MNEKDKCILDLLSLLQDIDKKVRNHDLSIFRTSGIGGCDMYQGMTPFQKSLYIIENKHIDTINQVLQNSKLK